MKIKEIIIVCLIVCFIFSISSVSAVDVDSDDTNNTALTTADSDVVKKSNDLSTISLPENTTLLGDGEGSFSELSGHLNGDYTLDKDYKYGSSDTAYVNGITIDKSITIDGKGHSIDGDNQARIFNIAEGASVTLKNIKLINGKTTDNGGAIYSQGTISLENCTFINNNAKDGGAIYLHNLPGLLTKLNFTDNHATHDGGAIYYHPDAAVSEEDGLTNSVFTGNTAGDEGGALYLNGNNGNMRNVNFTSNIAANDGGAIMIIGANWRVYDSTFKNNNATTRRGGAIYLENSKGSTVSNSKFYNNTAGTNGGAIDWHNGAENGRVINTIFIDNTAKRSGGAIYWYGHNGTILSSNFTDNKALGSTYAVNPDGENLTGGDGGAVLWTGDLGTVDDCIFKYNTADKRGGAVFLRGTGEATCKDTSFTNSKFINNTAGTNGGAIDWNKGAQNGIIDTVEFINNTALRSGGAVFWYGYNGTIRNSNFTHNYALGVNNATSVMGEVTYGGDGGAVIWTGSLGIVDNCNFNENEAAKRGGAVFLQGTSEDNCTNTTFKNSNFTSNVAGTNGGAIDWNKGARNGIVYNVTFIDNTAKRSGGAVFWYGYNGTIRNSNFTHNYALGVNNATSVMGEVTYGGDGGAVIWTGSLGIVDNCNFNENEAAKRGGAVFLQGTSEDNCTNTTFKNSNFTSNVAGTNGGAIDWNKGARNGIVYNVTFIDNTAKRSGGAIFWNGHNGTISWTKFYNNRALGINNATSVMGEVTYGGDGGAVMWSGALGTVFYSNFVNNTAAKRGGAVFLQGTIDEDCDNTTFKNSYFADNIAGTNGGAVDWYAGAHHGIVDNVTFINNTAKRSGGAIFWHGNDGVVKNSKFTNNRATGEYLQYDMDLKFDDVIIVNSDTLPVSGGANKLYVLNYTSENGREFKSYVYDDEKWILLDETTVIVETISPKDWAIDQFFGGDGGTILWSGDIGLVYNCTFVESNSARRGGGAYMTGSDHITYDSCQFINCTSGTNGGGVDWLAGANYGKIYNCVFNATRAARSAGAIYYDGWYGELENITIINTVSYGGALKTSRDGRVKYAGWDSSHWDTNTTGGDAGAIMFTGNHEYIYNVTFTNCNASGRGGAVFLQDNANITFVSCNFTNNRALGIANNTFYENGTINRKGTGLGGAIAFDIGAHNGRIIDCNFIRNDALYDGGAINYDEGSNEGTIRNSLFQENTAGDDGGAINWEGDNGHVYNITCVGNVATGRADRNAKGGTVCLTGDNITIEKVITNRSSAVVDGGSFYIAGNNITIIEAFLTQTNSYNGGGAIYIVGDGTKIKNSTIMRATSVYGGAIYIEGNNANLENVTITMAVAKDGGAIYIAGDNATIFNSHITLANATNGIQVGPKYVVLFNGTDCSGGAIYIRGDGAVFNQSSIMMSNALYNAGDIYLTGNNATICNSTFGMSSASNYAGAIQIIGNYSKVYNCTFDKCRSDEDGGALYVSGLYCEVSNSTFTFNRAGGDGGALHVAGQYGKLYNSNFTHNFAGDDGGAINWIGNNGDIYNIACNYNTATGQYGTSNGGTMSLEGNNTSIAKSSFRFTSAVVAGGAIFITGNYVNVTDSEFEYCNVSETISNTGKTYVNGGGALYVLGNYTNVLNNTFMRTHARQGGVIYVQGNGANIDRAVTEFSYAPYGGGAVYVEGANITISNSSFTRTNSSNIDGGAIYVHGANAVITTSNFTMNNAKRYGGSIYISGFNATILDSNFALSNATDSGGSIYIQGDLTEISGSTFTKSHADRDGGVIYVSGKNAYIYDSDFLMSSSNMGGAVFIAGYNATIVKSTFDKVNATQSGGAIYIEGQYATVANSNISNSVAKSQSGYVATNLGGAIYISGNNANISYSKIDLSTAMEGGAIYSIGSHSTVYYSNFTDNIAQANGGAIYWFGGSAAHHNTVEGCVFINNTAYGKTTINTKGGGAIYWSEGGTYGVMKDSKFINNSARTSNKADGGAVLLDRNAHVKIDGCIFDGNYVRTSVMGNNIWVQGGAIYIRSINVTINNTLFENCWSQMDAGAVYLSNDYNQGPAMTSPHDISIINTKFVNNTAKAEYKKDDYMCGGGAILIKQAGNIYLENVTCIDNKANEGGAITVRRAKNNNIFFVDSTFIGNSAENYGGSIYILLKDNGPSYMNMDNVTIINSTADMGGGLYAADNNKIGIKYNDLTFINNSARISGALQWDYNGGPTIEKINFINNTASEFGGAIYIPNNNFKILTNNFTGNSALYGGAIYVFGSNAQIESNNFTGNSAVYGGAIYTPQETSKQVSISRDSFTSNSAENGGAIYIGFSGPTNKDTISYCNFTNNTASENGGAIYMLGNNIRVGNCIFDGNNATLSGGAIYVTEDLSTTLHDSIFKNSHADNGGAVYYANSTTYGLRITDDDFINNIAEHNGGAILYVTTNRAYRDYLNFDGLGIIDDQTGRTNVFATDTQTRFITNSLFENQHNRDYLLLILTDTAFETPMIEVYLQNPRDQIRRSVRFVVNLTLNGTLQEQVIVTSANYNSHITSDGRLFVVFDRNVMPNKEYNITVGFYDENYMYKENSTTAVPQGTPKGEFQLLQETIEKAISDQKGNGLDYYELNLTRGYRFNPYYFDTPLDDRCMNLTNIDRPLIINGNGNILNALGYARIFNITASNVTLNNITFAYGDAGGQFNDSVDMGGAIFWAGANGKVINSNFIGSTANIGGGIYYNASAPDCQIINTVFDSNFADTNGGAIDCNASNMGLYNTTFISNQAETGAALCREINATKGHGYNNTFTDNYAVHAGAALAWINATSISIDTYYFYNNHVGYSGGAIYVGPGSKNCTILNCDFEGNYVDNPSDGHGGAIEWYSEKGLVKNSTFVNNYAYDGGAIYVGSASGEINITESTFRDNFALTTGGAVSIEASAVTVNASNFYNNNATRGGALYVGGEGTDNYIYGSVFEGNKAISSSADAMDGLGGAIDWVASSGYIYDSNFTSNCADYGGGIYFGEKSEKSVIGNCIFTDNHAKYDGGAIDCNASSMVLTNTLFDGNHAQFGAALCRETNAKSGSGANNTFKNNHAIVVGAALGWMGSVGITIINYTFINNSADVAGGAIYVSPTSHNCSVIDCNFEDNYVTNKTKGWIDNPGHFDWIAWDGSSMYYRIEDTIYPEKATTVDVLSDGTIFYYQTKEQLEDALGTGGAMSIFAANATIVNTNFTGGSARSGGGLYVGAYSGNTILNHTVFRSNTAYENGGAVNLYASAVHIDDSKFYNNLAVNGSALYVGGEGTENKVHDSIFIGNNATDYGGGIYWVAYTGEIFNSEFAQNNARWGGGIYFNGRSANTNVVNTTFKSNTAIKNGGAIECNASNIGIYNLTFEDNVAGEYGAALCREIEATGGHGTNNTFNRNHAGISGAALAWMGVTNIHIIDYKFVNNTAESSGGAIFIDEGSNNDIIENCTFEGNHLTNMTVGHNGGAIDCRGENLTIDYVNFTNNGAHTGGAIYMGSHSNTIRIFDANFTNNYAIADGGALGLKADSLTINNTYFTSNTAGRHGGAVYAGGNGTNNTIRHAAFVGNSAGDHGGAINWLASAGTFEYINFRANTAEYGGAIYLNGVSSNSTLNTIYFIENRATKNGGAIDCNATRMGLSNVQFISNYAGEYGAALCREANATGGFGGNNTFISNHADIAGAALAWLGVDNININNYTFINNTAYSSGGAIYVREDSPNCKVRNCYFDNNYVTDVRNGQGGAIDWLGDHGYIYNTTFVNSFAVNGGTLYVGIVSEDMNITDSSFTGSRAVGEGGSMVLYGDNVNIIRTNFTYSIGLTRGGAISAYQAHNITIVDCLFDHTVGAGYVDQSNTAYGDGGAIYLKDGSNLNITNVKFQDVESHAMGTVTVINCSDSVIYNSTFSGMFALAHGGSVAWINSTNVTVDKCNFLNSGASYNGGSIFFNNTNAVVKNSLFNNTSTPWGNGGAIYINGNVTVDNSTFDEYSASKDNAGAIYLHAGNSTISNSSFNGKNAIWIDKNANATISEINITGDNPNDNLKYLVDDYNSETNPVFYAIWNDGHLYLKGNNFDYVSFNNGTIWSQTYVYMLSNETYNVTWMDEFTFWAEILDDTQDNHIISVDSMYATNDVYQEGGGTAYPMTYNRVSVPEVYYQGAFHLRPNDPNLKKYEYKNGTVNVKMPLKLNLTYEIVGDVVKVTAQLTPKAKSNFTLKDDNLYFKINDKEYYPVHLECTPTQEGYFMTWTLAIGKDTLNNLSAGHYTITAYHPGDEVHWDVINSTSFDFEKRQTWIKILIENTVYGVYPIANVTTNGNGTVLLSMNGRTERYDLSKNATYKDGVYTLLVKFDTLYAPGNYTMSAVYEADEYYEYSMNNTDFEIFKRNVTISANATDIKFVEVEYINATLSIIIREGEEVNITELQPISGFVRVVLAPGQEYAAKIIDGVAKFVIPNLFSAEYKNVEVIYDGDYFYNGNMTYINFTVAPTDDFTVDVKVDNITYGQNATVRVKVPSWANGTATIYVDGIEWGTVNLTDGTAQLTNVTGLAGGDHVVNATYNGGQYYAAKNSTNVTFNVAPKSDWDVAIVGDYQPYGEYSTFTIRNIPEGIGNNITVRIDDVDYVLNVTVNGTAVLKLNNLTAGKHNGTVVYAGNANYSSLNKKFYPDIPKATPTVTLIQNGTDLVAVVSGNVTGNVTFRVNGDSYYTVNLTANNATLIGKLRIGDNYVIATYNGNGNYTTADAANVFTVDKLNTTITVNSTNIKFGENEIINVTVDERAEGFIAINIDGKIYVEYVNHGAAQFNITGLAAKNYTDVRVTYYPATSDFNGNFTTTSFIVDPTDKYPIDVKVDNITYGQNATVRVLVATDAVGNVTISIDGKINKTVNLTNGVAVWENIAGLAGGEHVVNVTYNGGPRYAPKDHNGTVFKVNPASWKVDITEVDYRPYGQTTTINITNIPADFKGKNLTIKIDGISYVVPIVDGKATLRLNNLSAGSHMATVNYAGDANYSNISQVFRPNIPQAIPTIALEEVNGDIVATVSGVNATGNVTFYLNGKEYTIDLTSGRTATLTKDYLIIGNNSIVAIYNGDKNYTSARTVGNFTVDKLASTVTVTVVDTEYGIPVEVIVQVGENQTGFVEIYVNGLTYVGELKQGEARFYIMGLNVNKYTVNVTYYENDIYHSSKNSTSFNVTKADITATVVAQNVTVEQNASFAINNVTRDFNGNVTIVINGHVYYNGTVKSPIEIARIIQANNYTANVTFYGDNNYNNKSYPVNFTVSRVDPTIDVTIADVTYPAIASAIVTVSNGATGAIGIYLGDVLVGSGTITDGQATTIDLIRLAAGLNKEVTVKFITSDDYNNNATATAEFNVIKGNTTVSIERNGTDVIAVVTPGVSGNVTFIINGEEFENVTVNGNATIVDKLHIGNNTVSVIYRGNENYTGNDSATVFEIVKITTALTVEATPEVVVGKNTTIIVRMTNVTSGRVLIDVNGYNYTVDINSSGVAKLVVALPVDDYTAHAYYLGDLEHEACDNVSAVFKVLNKTAPSVTIADVGNIEIDTNLTFTVTTNSNVTLVVRVNGEVVNQSADGKYRYNGTVAKEYNITASVAENDYYFKASNYTLFNVYKHASEIASVVAAPENVIAGKNTSVTVTMANNETGKVMIEINGHNYTVEINDQHKAVLVVTLPAGNYTAHAYYLGDDKYNATDKVSAEFNVTAKRNATVIINAVSVVEIDGKLIFNVTNSTPVVVTINDVVYTPVNGNYTFDAVKAGNYTIVARSVESDEYYAGFNSTTFRVIKHNSSVNITVGNKYEIETSFEIGIQNSTVVNVTINGKVYNVVGGKVSIDTAKLAAGNYTVTATIYESDKYLANSTTKTFTVFKHNATISSVVVPNVNVGVGKNATITVTMGNVTTGTILIEVNGYNYTVAINEKVAELNVTLPIGKYHARAYFLGDDLYNPVTSDLSSEFTVADKRIVSININAPGEIEVDNNLVFTVTNSTPVNVTVNGVKVEIKDGKYTYNVTEAGIATIVVTSNETDELYAGYNSTTVVVLKHKSTVSIDPVAPHFVGDNFEILVHNNTAVVVTVNGKEYSVADGKVVIDTTKLIANEYVVTAYIKENDKYLENSSTIKFNITKRNSSINITVGNKYEIETSFEIGIQNSTVVNVTINGKVYSVENGKVSIDTTKLAAGNYTVTATIYESGKYLGNVTSDTFEIYKHASDIESVVATPTVVVGKNTTVTVTMANNESGKVMIEINGHNYTVEINNQHKAVLVVALPAGNYTAHAYYLGDDKYNATDKVSAEFNVTAKRNATVIINAGEVVEIDGKLIFNVTNSTPVVVTINDVVYTPVNGNYTFDAVKAGNYTIVARSVESDEYYAGFNSTTFRVIKHNSSVNITVGNKYEIESEFEIGIQNSTVVNVTINGKVYNVVGGKVSIDTANLAAGNYTVTATIYESDRYCGNVTSKTFEITKHASQISIKTSPIDVGQIAVINITASNYNGSAIVNLNNNNYSVVITNGIGQLKVSDLRNGTYDITVTYLENDKYLSNTNATTLTVSKVTPQITASVENITDDKNAAFEITLPEDATGTVTIKVNDTISITVGVTGGVNKVLVENLKEGEYNVNITYNGNDKYNPAKANVTLKVTKAIPPVIEGVQVIDQGNGTVKIVVPGNSTGNVTIKVGNETYNATVENGTAIIDLNNVTPGSKDITIKYVDENGQTAEINSTVNIPKYATPITIDVTDGVVGTPVEITVTVDGNVTKEITIEVDGKNYTKSVDNGKAVFTVDLTAGNKTVTATYAGDDKYMFNSTTEQFKVSRLPAPMSVSASVSGNTATITVSGLPSDVTGYVIVKVNGVEYGINITSTKEVKVPLTYTGNYDVVASYLGDDKYMANTSSTSFHATIGEENITIDLSNTTVGSDLVIKVDVPQDADGNITVTVDNQTITQKVVPGENVITVPGLSEGAHDLNVTYSGDSKYDSKTVVQTIYVSSTINAHDKQTRGWDSPYDFTAEFLDKDGHVLKDTDVQIQVNGKTYTVRTDNEGIAYLTDSNLPVGTYDVVCLNTVTGQNVTYKLTIVKRILENKDLTMDFASGKSFKVKVIGDDGNPAPAGEYVAITINGIKYAAVTDANGYASLKINLNPGKYTVTAEYKNTKTTNKVTVKQTLKLVKKTVSVKKGKKLVLKAKLKWSNGKAINGKVIKFKFKGKTYKAKTNKKGIAKVTVKSNVTKKLKKGKKYTYVATYLSNTVKGKVKVK